MLKGCANIEQQWAFMKLKNRRVQIRIVEDGNVEIHTKKLIPFDEIEKYREQGFRVRGRVAEFAVSYTKEVFSVIFEGHACLTNATSDTLSLAT